MYAQMRHCPPTTFLDSGVGRMIHAGIEEERDKARFGDEDSVRITVESETLQNTAGGFLNLGISRMNSHDMLHSGQKSCFLSASRLMRADKFMISLVVNRSTTGTKYRGGRSRLRK